MGICGSKIEEMQIQSGHTTKTYCRNDINVAK